MINLQQYLDQKFSTAASKKEVKEIILENEREKMKNIDGGELDLSAYTNLKRLALDGNYLKNSLDQIKTWGDA